MLKGFKAPIRSRNPEAKGFLYYCNHPLYNECTLFLLPSGKGLGVIQQRFNEKLKYTWWGRIDEKINVAISNAEELDEYLNDKARYSDKGIYPHVEVRKMMWALRIPPLKKQSWETRF